MAQLFMLIIDDNKIKLKRFKRTLLRLINAIVHHRWPASCMIWKKVINKSVIVICVVCADADLRKFARMTLK